MKALFKLAWRNIWRNKRRTAITLASIGFGLAALLFQQSLIKSLQDQLVEKSTRTYSAHLQIQSKDATDPKVPDARIADSGPLIEAVKKIPEVGGWSERLIFTGLISSAVKSQGALIFGMDPLNEPGLTIIGSYVTEGRYLQEGADREAMIGVKLAREMDLRLGEKFVVMVQGADGSLSAEAFRVAALFRTDSPVYDGQIVYVPIQAAQRLLVCGKEVSLLSIHANRLKDIETIQKKLKESLKDQPVDVLTWKESSHEIVSIQQFQDGILLVVLLVIFSIVALGIFNTLLMSLFERIREFGLMLALGAKPQSVFKLILVEAVLLGVLGVAAGLIAGSALIAYFGVKGVPLPIQEAMGYWMPFDRVIYLRFAWKEMAYSAVAALLTSLLAALFPALRAARLQPVDALRHY